MTTKKQTKKPVAKSPVTVKISLRPGGTVEVNVNNTKTLSKDLVIQAVTELVKALEVAIPDGWTGEFARMMGDGKYGLHWVFEWGSESGW